MNKELTRKQRQDNATKILDSLNVDEQNFNTILLGFVDIIQSTFYNYLKSQSKSQNELKKMHDRVNEEVNNVIDVLEENSLSNPEDMVVLSTVMLEAIYKAIARQEENGNTVQTRLGE